MSINFKERFELVKHLSIVSQPLHKLYYKYVKTFKNVVFLRFEQDSNLRLSD